MKNKELKKRFEEWYSETLKPHLGLGIYQDRFKTLSQSMQWGVMQDFYDSEGIGIEIEAYWGMTAYRFSIWKQQSTQSVEVFKQEDFKTRPQAREQALIKAEEIWVERNE